MTKKLLFTFLLVALFSSKINAQAEAIEYGFKIGTNRANVVGDETDTYYMRGSVHMGVLVDIPVIEYMLSVQPELLYSFQGHRFLDEDSVYDDHTLKLDYIVLPVMVKYYFTPGFNVEAGPQIGMLTSALLEAKTTENGVTERTKEKVNDIISDIDYGVNVGLGYQFEIGLFLQARYYVGLAGIVDVEEGVDQRNTVLQFSAGYKF
ncbi:hypothetical protein GCM10022393_14110 [Aquimarina addita]|uniref:Outer membrane protein beta-barrel domain-containing protein n=1 Tax=Aquimarina addita TaxID=870485 RepID=A0ABP7XFP9_9FLAO